MTDEQKACLAACKSFDADVERAEYIHEISTAVIRERCKKCNSRKLCAGTVSLPCRMEAVASVAVGIIQEGGAK